MGRSAVEGGRKKGKRGKEEGRRKERERREGKDTSVDERKESPKSHSADPGEVDATLIAFLHRG